MFSKYALPWILFRVQSEKCTINLPVLVVNKDWRSKEDVIGYVASNQSSMFQDKTN